MKRTGRICLLVVFVMSLISSCGVTQLDAEVSTLIITQNQEIVHVLVEEFNEQEYSATALREMIQQEIESYHEAIGGGRIVLDQLIVEYEMVKMKMTYDSNIDYQEFNDIMLFIGSIEEALELDYIPKNVQLMGVDEEATYSREQIRELEESDSFTVVIVDEVVGIRVPEPIRFYTKGLELSGDMELLESQLMTQTIVIY